LIPVIILNFTSFRIAFVEGPFLPEKVPFKTGRIHGFSNRNAADDAEAVWRSHKKKSAKNYGLDRKAAFPTNRRNHGCETELFPEVFVSFAAVPECRFSIPAPEFHRSVASLLSSQGHIPFGRSFSFQFAPQLVVSEKGRKLTPSIINWELFCRLHERIL